MLSFLALVPEVTDKAAEAWLKASAMNSSASTMQTERSPPTKKLTSFPPIGSISCFAHVVHRDRLEGGPRTHPLGNALKLHAEVARRQQPKVPADARLLPSRVQRMTSSSTRKPKFVSAFEMAPSSGSTTLAPNSK